MSTLVDDAMGGYEPTTEPSPTPAIFEVLGAVCEMVTQFAWVYSVPVRSVTEVRGWHQLADLENRIIDCMVDGRWMAFAL